jgi:hypothetical protein
MVMTVIETSAAAAAGATAVLNVYVTPALFAVNPVQPEAGVNV